MACPSYSLDLHCMQCHLEKNICLIQIFAILTLSTFDMLANEKDVYFIFYKLHNMNLTTNCHHNFLLQSHVNWALSYFLESVTHFLTSFLKKKELTKRWLSVDKCDELLKEYNQYRSVYKHACMSRIANVYSWDIFQLCYTLNIE